MTLFKKYWLFVFLIFLLFVAYFAIRLPSLTLQPIFADEAIYIRWAQVMKAEPTLRFLPVSDGKTPLWMWILMPVFKFIEDPLLAGRLLSVFCGSLTLLGVLFLGWKYFNRQTAFWAGFLIVITPFIVFFDRMALVDTLLSAFSIWSLIFTLLLVEYKRLDLAMILGGILGGGWLTKTPGLFSVLSVPFGVISFMHWRKDRSELIKILGLMLVSIIIGLGFYNILRLGPGFDALSSRNGDYIHSPLHLLRSPFDPFYPHMRDLYEWFPKFLTIPILISLFGGVLLTVYRRQRYAIVILLWSLFPLLIEMALLRTFTTRYILFTIPPLLFLAGWFIAELIEILKGIETYSPKNLLKSIAKIGTERQKQISGFGIELGVIVFFMLVTVPFHMQLWSAPEYANIPRESKRGYFEDWTAGVGLKEIADYLKNEARDKKVVVGTAGAFGTLPDGLYIYLDKAKNVSVMSGNASVSAELRKSAEENDTYFVANKSQYGQPDSGIVLIKEFPKHKGTQIEQDFMLLYKVLPIK